MEVIRPMPNAAIPPTMPANVLPKNQNACLKGCSFLVYHIDTTTLSPGAMGASTKPRKKRTARIPAELTHNADIMRTNPQTALYIYSQQLKSVHTRQEYMLMVARMI